MATSEYVRGMKAAQAAFQKMPQVMRDRLNVATDLTAREIVRVAKSRVASSPAVETRALLNNIAFTLNEKTGRGKVGVSAGSTSGLFAAGTGVAGELKRRRIKGVIAAIGNRQVKRVPSRYAHLVEFGTIHMPAEPFMIPAADAQKGPFLDRCRSAIRQGAQDLANVGSRFV